MILGAIEQYSEDELLLGSSSGIPKPLYKFDDYKLMYNQDKNGYARGCVFHAGLACIGDQTNTYFDQDNWNRLAKIAYNYGRREQQGMLVNKGADAVVEYRNSISDNPVYKYQVKMNSDLAIELMDMGYSIHTGYRGNASYNTDKNDDCELDNSQFGEGTYGHSIRLKKTKGVIQVVDNYLGTSPCNVYSIKEFKELLANQVFFVYGYIYIFTKPQMKPINVNYNKGNTPDEVEIVKAWENELTNGYEPQYKNYTDSFYITKMLIDISNARAK